MLRKIKQYAVIILFCAAIFFPMLLTWMGKKIDLQLSGVSETQERAELSLRHIMTGEWQNGFESWYKEKLSVRDPLIRAGNQFVFTCFRKSTNERLAVGDNKNIFEKEYIYEIEQLKSPVTDVYIEELIGNLKQVNEKLEKQGKHLFIYITPEKTYFYEEDIPWAYRVCAPQKQESSYEKLAAALAESGLAYYDTVPYVRSLKEEQNMEIFSKTGTHWTQLTGAYVAIQLSKEISGQFGYDLTEFAVNAEAAEAPVFPDADIFNSMNVLEAPYDYYYDPQFSVLKEGTDKPGLFMRGGSFMGQSMAHLIRHGVFGSVIHMENTMVFPDNYVSAAFSFQAYEELDMKQMLADKDLVVLEVNQGAIDRMSFGLIEYLLEAGILD